MVFRNYELLFNIFQTEIISKFPIKMNSIEYPISSGKINDSEFYP